MTAACVVVSLTLNDFVLRGVVGVICLVIVFFCLTVFRILTFLPCNCRGDGLLLGILISGVGYVIVGGGGRFGLVVNGVCVLLT